jgi:hypothetical protein
MRTGSKDLPEGAPDVARAAQGDPIRLCVYTTIGLIAWAISPPATVALFGSLGLIAYGRAWRAGARRSRCFLGDLRLVMTYLAVVTAAGVAVTARSLLHLFT